MPRDLVTAVDDAIAEPVVRPFIAVRIELADPVYAWTGLGDITFDDAGGTSRTWTGVGELGAIDPVREATDGQAVGVKVSLMEVPADLAADIQALATQGALMEIYFGALATTDETFSTVEGTKLIWKGTLDTYEIIDAGDQLIVEIAGENRARDQRRPAIKRFTDEWQQEKYPGDKFFEYVSQMTEVPILWGDGPQDSAPVGGSGSGWRNKEGGDARSGVYNARR